MTGFGKATYEKDGLSIAVEVKTLNSKGLDVHLRLPKSLSSKELEIRNIVAEQLLRGKVNLSVDLERTDSTSEVLTINEALFTQYYHLLKHLADKVNDKSDRLFDLALGMPNVYENKQNDDWVDEAWSHIEKALKEGIQACDVFRIDEGRKMEESILANIEGIQKNLSLVKDQDVQRLTEIRNRLNQAFVKWEHADKMDANRFEQELIFYLEKLDINEEKVRLQSHIDYFLKMLNEGSFQGKKLHFISQEMGREINTIGSKANDHIMQQYVVNMKDELEQIKEQLANIL